MYGPKIEQPKGAGPRVSYCVQIPLRHAWKVTVAYKLNGQFMHSEKSFQLCCIVPGPSAGVATRALTVLPHSSTPRFPMLSVCCDDRMRMELSVLAAFAGMVASCNLQSVGCY